MAFGLFKKKNNDPHYDPTNMSVEDLRKGFVIDYDLKSWEVQEEYEYDWGHNNFSYEYKLACADDMLFLYVERDDEDELFVAALRKIKFSMLDEEVEDKILDKGKPPREVEHKGIVYYREEESSGYYKNVTNKGESQPFMSWTYFDEGESKILSIEQWGDEEFAAAAGVVMDAGEITNILPGASDED